MLLIKAIMSNDAWSENIDKLVVDDESDFGFHAAYLTYAKVYDENNDEEMRLELNQIMLLLAENKDYSAFYREIGKYRKNASTRYSNTVRFKTQKKRAWRRNLAKKTNMSRHRNQK